MLPAIGLVVLLALSPLGESGQGTFRERGSELMRQSRYAEAEEVFWTWTRVLPNDPDAHYLLALTRALQGKTAEAREGFVRVLALDPRRADACFELAATYVKAGDADEAIRWALRGLRLEPADPYGLDVAGTAYYLAGAKDEALRRWNQIGRPHLTELRILTDGSVARQTIADEIDLGPGDLLSWKEVQKARWRLAQHDYFRSVVFNPVPGATPDEYSLEVAADARRGVGSPWEMLFNSVSEISFRTLRFDYWNVGGSSVTLSARWRWVPAARWLQARASIPRLRQLPLYATVTFDRRDEAWTLAPGDARFDLRTQELGVRAAIPVRLPSLSVAASVIGRQRAFRPDTGAAPPAWLPPQADRAGGAVWLRAAPRFVLPAYRLTAGWSLRGAVRAGVESGWAKGSAGTALVRASLSPEMRAERTVGGSRRQVFTASVHAGVLSRDGLVEDHFVLGVGPDAEYPLRAHPYLRDGRPGSAPLAGRFLLGNFTASTDVFRWGWFRVGAVGFADCAWIERGYPGQGLRRQIVDVGAGVELSSAWFGSGLVTVIWGRDWYGRRNVVYVGTSLR